MFNKLKARIDLSSSLSIQHSKVTAIEDTGKTIQHSQVTAKSIQLSQVDKEHIGAKTSQ